MPTLSPQVTPYYGGGQVVSPANVIQVSGAPSTAALQNNLGTLAVDPTSGTMYGLVAKAGGSATWAILGGGSGAVATLTGDSGGAVSPTGGNITITGGTTGHTFAGSSSTLTLGGTLGVANGGTGATTLTTHGVLVGEGTSAIAALAVGSTGQVLIGSSAADPAFGALGVNSGLTAHGVLIGEGNSAIVATSVGTTGQVLIGSSAADPAFAALGVNSGLSGLVLGNNNSAFTTTSFTAAGSFVPAFSLGTPGDSSWTYSSRVGRYTQIGALVFFVAELVVSNFTNSTGSGNWQLNLPVTSGAFARTGHIHISGSGINASAQTANLPANFVGEIGSGANVVVLSVEEGGTGNASSALFNLTVSQVLTSGTYTVTGWYFAA